MHILPPARLCAALLFATPALVEPSGISLPDGFTATLAAAPPLVLHPITASVGGPGVLFVCDMAGVNLNKEGLEKELPNRVVRLADTDGDGTYDRQTVFADRLTFPNGGVWLGDSFYVCSAPALWKLTDADGDGVAEQRTMIASGFEFTGNAADLHGPFLHPNGRLYWCHGRKGYKATQSDGKVVATGLSSGIWSCRPDGLDLRWHSLVAGDNPVEIDFTPEGEIVGTMNLYFSRPRGDVIVHWLRGGVYPREDQLKVIAGLPRTLEVMPVVHNFGHVAVSGCAFYRSGALDPDWRGNLFVTHFNTRRVTRMEMTRAGATFKVAEREFLTLQNPDAHITDVLEDRDGSLLVVDTGGWFRNGCPASLISKPDVPGAIYRIQRKGGPIETESWDAATAKVWTLARKGEAESVGQLIALLGGRNASLARAAGNALATCANPEATEPLIAALKHQDPGVQLAAAHALGARGPLGTGVHSALLQKLEGDLEAALEHQTMDALLGGLSLQSQWTSATSAGYGEPDEARSLLLAALESSAKPALRRRAFRLLDQMRDSPLTAAQTLPLLDATDPALARDAAAIVARHEDWMPAAAAHFTRWLEKGALSAEQLAAIETAARPWLAQPAVREFVTTLLKSSDLAQQRAAWRVLGAGAGGAAAPAWVDPLQTALANSAPGDQALVIAAIARQTAPELTAALAEFSADQKRPLPLRLKALGASPKSSAILPDPSFALLTGVLKDGASPAARLEAARLLATARLGGNQILELATRLATLGPLELRELMPILRKVKDLQTGTALAHGLKDAGALGSLQESEIRSAMSAMPPKCFEIVAPALRALAAANEAQRRQLETLPALVATKGRAEEGRQLFAAGKGACMSCHRVGEVGNMVGPELSAIGRIRSPRDLLESVMFPNASMAQGYEAHTVETAAGQSLLGVIRRNLPDAIVLVDPTGQEQTIPRTEITGLQALPTSLMPPGLDRTLSEQELLDLVAFLASRK